MYLPLERTLPCFGFSAFFGIICCNLWVRWCCKFSAATATALSSCRSNNFGYRLLQVGRPNEVRAAACQSQVESTSTSTSQSGLTDDWLVAGYPCTQNCLRSEGLSRLPDNDLPLGVTRAHDGAPPCSGLSSAQIPKNQSLHLIWI